MKKGLRILQDLALVPEGRSCAIIIRHGDRDGAKNALVDTKEQLIELGRKRSVELGHSLRRFDNLRMYSSPVGRCMETCQRMGEGFGPDCSLEATEFLGMSAPTMLQPEVAYSLMRSMGLNGFVEAYVQGRIDRKVAMPCEEGTKLILSFALERMRGSSNSAVPMVTHDMVITPALAKYFDYDFRAHGLVPFLDGMILYESDYGLRLCHGGKVLKVAKDGAVRA